jgi:hypothetical protein
MLKEWDESLYERDENGRFASNGGGGSNAKPLTISALDKAVREAIGKQKEQPGQSWRLKGIIAARGFDAKPQVVSSVEELEGTPLYRGINGDGALSKMDASEMAQQFVDGDMHVGLGIFGDGVYFTSEKNIAASYAYGESGTTARGAIITGGLVADAKILELAPEPGDDYYGFSTKQVNEIADTIPREIFARYGVGQDVSTIATLAGYDAIHIPVPETNGDAFLQAKFKGGDQYIILNRGAMQVVG